MALTSIIYEQINDKYSRGKYGEFEVIMMTSNTYINATKLCNQYYKDFTQWKRNDGSDNLIIEVDTYLQSFTTIQNSSNKVQVPGNSQGPQYKSIIIINTGINNLRGTYVHPLLIPHIASWISPKFAIKVSHIVNDRMTMYLRNENSELKMMIKQLSDKNDKEFATLNEKIDNITDDLQVNTEILEQSVVDRSVKPDDSSLTCQFVLLSSGDSEDLREYYPIRRQKKTMSHAINKLKQEFPIVVLTINCVPNSIYLWTNIKKHESLKGSMDFIDSNVFMLNITEDDFKNRIMTIFTEKETKGLPKKRTRHIKK